MGISIRAARAEDAEALVALLNPIILAGIYTVMDEPATRESQLDFIRGFPERGVFHVAEDAGAIVGMQDVMPITPDIRQLRHVCEISTFVSIDARRSGIGRSLTSATVMAARECGFRKIIAMIRADNPDAVAFYEDQGFRIIGTAREHALVGGKFIDEILSERLID